MDTPFFVLIKLYAAFVGVVVLANVIAGFWEIALAKKLRQTKQQKDS